MSIWIKVLIVFIPFIVAFLIGSSLLQPLLEEANAKDQEIAEKTSQNDGLLTKLADADKWCKREIDLKKDIDVLRESVPKTPDMDLLVIDFEQMCKDAGMNMVAFETPKDTGSSSDEAKAAALKQQQDSLKNAVKGAAGKPGAAAQPAAVDAESEFSTAKRELTVTGDYESLEKLVCELETYQRVVKITNISFVMPKPPGPDEPVKVLDSAAAEGERGDPDQLFIKMTLVCYYLP